MHLLWLMAMAVFTLPVLFGVVVVVLVASGRSGRRQAVQFSPDGRWWWDGHEWKPVPQQPAPTPGPPASGSGS